ncbi:short chain dehydrogenase [Chaetomium fimeti]|uniref:Short chain dehydrogenase n=1 Tax=Chaetomium fimeti TaxID=1854472 RepID=A0AAE0LXN2_9PEZI|nr:short chain dehydrogenase [Chaetomium fimeti]
MGQFASSERGHEGGPKSVLITGCSDGGLGAALATAFHNAGLHVYATARDVSKMKNLAASGIDTLELDVTSPSSIASCASKLPSLDILVNNAAVMLTMTAADVSVEEAKKLFDTNLWGTVRMCQAFLPLLIKSKGMIVNHTSIASVLPVPGGAAYAASKSALAMYSAILRMEVESFEVQVVDLKTGTVGPTNLINNNYTRTVTRADHSILPAGSCYQPAKDLLEPILRQDNFKGSGMRPAEWARAVTGDLLNNTRPPPLIFRGHYVILAKLAAWLPFGAMDGIVKKTTKFDQVDSVLRQLG